MKKLLLIYSLLSMLSCMAMQREQAALIGDSLADLSLLDAPESSLKIELNLPTEEMNTWVREIREARNRRVCDELTRVQRLLEKRYSILQNYFISSKTSMNDPDYHKFNTHCVDEERSVNSLLYRMREERIIFHRDIGVLLAFVSAALNHQEKCHQLHMINNREWTIHGTPPTFRDYVFIQPWDERSIQDYVDAVRGVQDFDVAPWFIRMRAYEKHYLDRR